MRAAKVQASLRIRAVSPEPSLLAHISSESRGTFRQKARSLAPLNGWACAVKMCHDGMLEDTNSLDGAHIMFNVYYDAMCVMCCQVSLHKNMHFNNISSLSLNFILNTLCFYTWQIALLRVVSCLPWQRSRSQVFLQYWYTWAVESVYYYNCSSSKGIYANDELNF